MLNAFSKYLFVKKISLRKLTKTYHKKDERKINLNYYLIKTLANIINCITI